MKRVPFHEVSVNDEFIFDGNTYIKIVPEKVSCCRSYVACLKNDTTKKITINPKTQVEVNDQ